MSNPEAIARDLLSAEKFSFADALRGRNNPRTSVRIPLDEDAAYKYGRVKAEIRDLELQLGRGEDAARINREKKALEKQLKEIEGYLAESTYTFHLKGIFAKDYDALIDRATEAYPYEYETVEVPLTGEKKKQIVESEKRAEYFENLLWEAYIEYVEAPNGAIDNDITLETVAVFKQMLPPSGAYEINSQMAEMRMVTGWVHELQDADFFPKP